MSNSDFESPNFISQNHLQPNLILFVNLRKIEQSKIFRFKIPELYCKNLKRYYLYTILRNAFYSEVSYQVQHKVHLGVFLVQITFVDLRNLSQFSIQEVHTKRCMSVISAHCFSSNYNRVFISSHHYCKINFLPMLLLDSLKGKFYLQRHFC